MVESTVGLTREQANSSTVNTAKRVLIVGAGIAGLTAALALRRFGVATTIVERSSTFGTDGAALGLQPNATVVLAALGVSLDSAIASSMGTFSIVNAKGKRLLSTTPASLPNGSHSLNVRRAELHEALRRALGALSIGLDRQVEGIERCENGALGVSFSSGEPSRWDVIIGADGLHSRVRQFVHTVDNCTPRYSGQCCWRFLLEAPDLAPKESVERWFKGMRIGMIPLTRGGIYVYIVASAPRGAADRLAVGTGALRERFGFLDPRLDAIFQRVIQQETKVHFGELVDLPPLDLGRGPVVLLGDAAHAMTPNMGQGAAMAIEDAAALALLWQGTLPEHLGEELTRNRLKRVATLHQRSSQMGRMAHTQNSAARWARDVMLRATPQSVMAKSMTESWHPGCEIAEQLQEALPPTQE